jgi:hypothetical protein
VGGLVSLVLLNPYPGGEVTCKKPMRSTFFTINNGPIHGCHMAAHVWATWYHAICRNKLPRVHQQFIHLFVGKSAQSATNHISTLATCQTYHIIYTGMPHVTPDWSTCPFHVSNHTPSHPTTLVVRTLPRHRQLCLSR